MAQARRRAIAPCRRPGSIVLATDDKGASKAETLFDAWGNPIVDEGQSGNKFGYTGHQMDEESGLIYAQARYYDPETGRFLTQDPAEGDPEAPLSYNSYLYAYGNPTVYTDPDGRKGCTTTPVPGGVVIKCNAPGPEALPGTGGPSNNDNESIARGIQRDLNALGDWFANKAQQARAYIDEKFSRGRPTPTPVVEAPKPETQDKVTQKYSAKPLADAIEKDREFWKNYEQNRGKTEKVTSEAVNGPSVTTTPLPEERGPTITSTPTPKPRSAWHTGNNKAAPVVPNNTAHGDGPPDVDSTTTSPISEPAGPNVVIKGDAENGGDKASDQKVLVVPKEKKAVFSEWERAASEGKLIRTDPKNCSRLWV
ncbi:MAG: RHS repeat-associated core domain-containing protein [Uliginosibacterium sp.]|nr:RHS repeat-associated core domain-containing protein [Uliginosibacterium sp.]